MKFFIFSHLLVFKFLFGLTYGAVFTPEFESDLRSFINVSMNCRRIPGMTLAVVKGDEVWTNGFGDADISSGKMVDEHTLFNIGSVTKSFTATLLGILLKENGLDWSAKVTEVLGSQYEFIDDIRTKELTMKDLLSHRTGLARLDIGLLAGEDQSVSRASVCKNLKYLPGKRPIRDGFLYNNFMYMMLGHVTEVLGRDTWENLVTSRILEPLGMNNTRILKRPQDVQEPDVARPYIWKDGDFQNGTSEIYSIHPSEPAGAILSSATDMAKWIKFNLDLGVTKDGTQLIEQKLMEQMHWATTPFDSQNVLRDKFLTKPQFPVDEIQIGYGYGWFVATYRGFKMIWHSGGLFSYITFLLFYPDVNTGIFASVNGPYLQSFSIRHLATTFYYISDQILGLEPWLNRTSACAFPEPWTNTSVGETKDKEVAMTVENLSEYKGSYSNPLLPDVHVTANSTNLMLRLNRIKGVLHPSSEKDRYLWEVTDPWELVVEYTDANNNAILTNITFVRDNHGTVNAFRAALEVHVTYTKAGMTSGGTALGIQVFVYTTCFLFLSL